MSENKSSREGQLDLILRELVTKRKFSKLDFEGALQFFCETLAAALDAPRVGIWSLNDSADELVSRVLWDQQNTVELPPAVLTKDDASTYLKAVIEDIVVIINDATNDPRCVELSKEYLPSNNVSALLDCPIRTYGGLAGVICIEDVDQPRIWTSEEVNFALAVSGLVSLTIEHNERNIAEKAAHANEDRLKLYSDLATDWFWETNTEFRFERLHGSAAVDGQMPDDYVGRKIWDVPILSPLDGNWDTLKTRVAARKRIYDFVVSATDEMGNTYYAEIAGLPKLTSAGDFDGYWGTAKDVTKRVQRGLDLAASEQKYKSASRIAKLGSWIWDHSLDACTYCSPELAEIYGVSVEEYLERTETTEKDLQWFHPDDRARYKEVISKAAREEVGYEVTARIVRNDGSVRTLHENTEAVFDSAGAFVATAGVLQDITEQVELRSQLKTHEDRLKGIVDNIPGAIYRVKYDDTFTSVYRSEGYLNLFVDPKSPPSSVTSGEQLPGLDIRASDRERIDRILRQAVTLNQPYEMEYSIKRRDGSEKWVSDRGRPVVSADGAIELEGIMIDATEKHAAQEALAHGQRLESVGKLTGGMAHDFNNLLAVVLGNLELLRDELAVPNQIELIDAGIGAVHRGADLTKNMLAFARKSRLNLETLDLNDLAGKSKNWIGRTLPENIEVETSLLAGLWKTETDASSAESALLNLIINARDAMPNGGQLTIETSNVRIDDHYVESRYEDIDPGRYVMLAISDTGHGIPKESLGRIFEPFYTTKPPGSGSGLGLSMIVGFMKQSGGSVQVYSEVGIGTTFKLYFKALTDDTLNQDELPGALLPLPHGAARILVVEDEQGVRSVLKSTLAKAGYDIQTASSGDEALLIYEADPTFDLLLTDIVMPGVLQGTSLAKALREDHPQLRVIFMSGYASEATVHGNGLRPEDIRLMKPVARAELIKAIENVLG
ncbi:PAS domain S-box protein [Falsiphaeobacter marinintestinus]|uniref:PAS domain S-box protein n=1 Tax=Falsiphaeobacter marinintestinus TaxID=1492905 RepID=UPI001644D392|nr:PAS domain S-box protein [Phaeobacter marinintestinus]